MNKGISNNSKFKTFQKFKLSMGVYNYELLESSVIRDALIKFGKITKT